MKKNFLYSTLIVLLLMLTFSLKSNAQVNRSKSPITIDYFTFDRIVNPTNLKIEYACYYDKNKKIFINAPEGNWSNTSTSEYLALVDPETEKPYKVRINGGLFEVSPDDGFHEIKKVNSIKFKGWDAHSYKIVVSDFLN